MCPHLVLLLPFVVIYLVTKKFVNDVNDKITNYWYPPKKLETSDDFVWQDDK